MGECNTILSAYTLYWHLGYYCTHPMICIIMMNFLLNVNILDLSKLKGSRDTYSKVAPISYFFLDKCKNIMRKGDNVGYLVLSTFLTKILYLQILKEFEDDEKRKQLLSC